MELFFELLVTAAASLLFAFLLAKLFSASDPRPELHDPVAGPAAVITEGKDEEGRIIEVDEVKVNGAREDVAAPIAEGWVEVDKPPSTVASGKTKCLVEEEGVPAKLPRELLLGTLSEERNEEGEVGKEQCDLAGTTETAVEANLRDLGAEAVPMEVLGVELDKERVHRHYSSAVVAPSEIIDAGLLQNQEVQAIEAAEVKQHHQFAGSAPAELPDAGIAGLEDDSVQAIGTSPLELASDTVPGEVLHVVPEKLEGQVIEVNQEELAAEIAQRVNLDVALAEKEELQENIVEGAVDVHVEVQSNEIVKCKCPVDQQEELVPKKTADLEVIQEGSSSGKVSVQLLEKDVTFLGMLEDNARDVELEDWEGIERSEVEKRFGAAAAFAASDAGAAALSKLDSDAQLQLQGLLKVAIDGPCYDSTQPRTLRPSSRAKWIAWQKLGNMHPEIAMEKYMNLLSEIIPGWMGDKTLDTKEHEADGDSEGQILIMTAHATDQHINQGNEDSTTMDDHLNPHKGQSPDVTAE